MPSSPFAYDSDYILSRVSITEILSALGGPRVIRGRSKCPLHQGKNLMSFSVNIEKGVWNCWSCGKQGGKLDLVVAMTGMSKAQAMKWVADLGGLSLDEPVLESERREMEARRAAVAKAKAVQSMREGSLDALKTYRMLLEHQLRRAELCVHRSLCGRQGIAPVDVAQEYWFSMNSRLQEVKKAIRHIEHAEGHELLKVFDKIHDTRRRASPTPHQLVMEQEYQTLLQDHEQRIADEFLQQLREANRQQQALRDLGLI